MKKKWQSFFKCADEQDWKNASKTPDGILDIVTIKNNYKDYLLVENPIKRGDKEYYSFFHEWTPDPECNGQNKETQTTLSCIKEPKPQNSQNEENQCTCVTPVPPVV